jgi:hypothetical protein
MLPGLTKTGGAGSSLALLCLPIPLGGLCSAFRPAKQMKDKLDIDLLFNRIALVCFVLVGATLAYVSCVAMQ